MNDDIDTIRLNLNRLAPSAKSFLLRLPIIEKRIEWRLRSRARRFTDEQDRAIRGYYEQFDAFAQNWYRTLQDDLKGIVPQREFMAWVRDTNPSAPGYRVAMTYNAVLRAKEIVEDLYRCRDLPRAVDPHVPRGDTHDALARLHQPETSSPEPNILALLSRILEIKKIGLETWLGDHPEIKRSTFMDWKHAGGKPVKRKVSVAKARELEAAILHDAGELGLISTVHVATEIDLAAPSRRARCDYQMAISTSGARHLFAADRRSFLIVGIRRTVGPLAHGDDEDC